jgi:hypothetical protein
MMQGCTSWKNGGSVNLLGMEIGWAVSSKLTPSNRNLDISGGALILSKSLTIVQLLLYPTHPILIQA